MAKDVIETGRLMQPIAHFSHAARVADKVYVGAIAGTDAHRRLAGTSPGLIDLADQAERAFSNLETVLELLNASVRGVTCLRAFVNDTRDIAAFERLIAERYPDLIERVYVRGSYGFPLPHAAVEIDAEVSVRTQLGDSGRSVSSTTGRYISAEPSNAAAGVADQVESAFDRLASRLEAADMALTDVVALDVSIAHPQVAEHVERAVRARFQTNGPCGSLWIAPLRDTAAWVDLVAYCVKGGGAPVDASGATSLFNFMSPAVLVGDELHIGAQCGNAELEGGSAEAQTRTAWQQVHALLEAAGLQQDDIVRTTNGLSDWRHYQPFNNGYGANVRPPFPPRTTVLTGFLRPELYVQIQAVAHRGASTGTILDALKSLTRCIAV